MYGTAMNKKWANEKKGFSTELVRLYAALGLNVTEPKGKSWHCQTLVQAEHDGVPYCVDSHGEQDPKDMMHGVNHRKLAIERHHTEIKAVYEFLAAKPELGDIWVLMGGGCQIQAFFGNHTGYLAIMYLTLDDLDEDERLTENGYLAACGNAKHVLQANWTKNNAVFRGFKVPGVKFEKSMG